VPEEKKCRHCAMQIPNSVKICPYCRKRQGIPRLVLVLAAFVVLIIIYQNVPPFMGNNNVKPGLSVPSFDDYREKAKQAAEEFEKKRIESENLVELSGKAKQIKTDHPSWTNVQCNDIADKRVWVGMTADQAISSWGKPQKRNKTVVQSGTHEQWVYPSDQYLYFENGTLTSLQQSQ
jgi:hypothetical protein